MASVTAPNNETIAFTYDAGGRLIETRLAFRGRLTETRKALMAYHVTILKTEGGKQVPLDLHALRELVAQRPDLTWHELQEGRADIAPSPGSESFNTLHWQNGEIWVANPTGNTLRIMLELAESLNARVRGDEYETYTTPDTTYIHPDDEAKVAQTSQQTLLLIRKKKNRAMDHARCHFCSVRNPRLVSSPY